MTERFDPIHPSCPHMMHGGDYNPDQWRATPEVWDQDMRLMRLSGCNAMTVGIFAWMALEPAEGKFDFSWLDTILDKIAANNAYAVLATPSGARPAWMSQKYPEVLRVAESGARNTHGERHNHCYTSPVYREKVANINGKLAERYKDHPSLVVWHLSNEYGGACYCPLCVGAFREWLRRRYDNDLDRLNHAWWTAFWSHTYTDWSQIDPPWPRGEQSTHGLTLDWKRFVTHQTSDFMRHEIDAIRKHDETTPITTNFMGTYPGLDYWKMAPYLDVISWDNYPRWDVEGQENHHEAARVGFVHDLNRSLGGGKPFMMMESTPSVTNWQPVAKLKRPGMHLAASLQAVAHGSDTVQYFQWRKSRGCTEKFHGAVVDHVGHENNRVFRDVAELGGVLARLDDAVGMPCPADVAVIFDWENAWALDDARGPVRHSKGYEATCLRHYRAFWKRGVTVDVIDMDQDFSKYKLLIAPMLYMVRPGVAERLQAFVEAGGVFVTTYMSGWVDESDLCFLGGFPGPLRDILGLWCEEIDALYPSDRNEVVMAEGNDLGLPGSFEAFDFCELIHAESADVLATYGDDFYAGRPAMTVNRPGKGAAYYIASRNSEAFIDAFYGILTTDMQLDEALPATPPLGVSAQVRTDGKRRFVFVLNFTHQQQPVEIGNAPMRDLVGGETVSGILRLAPLGSAILTEV